MICHKRLWEQAHLYIHWFMRCISWIVPFYCHNCRLKQNIQFYQSVIGTSGLRPFHRPMLRSGVWPEGTAAAGNQKKLCTGFNWEETLAGRRKTHWMQSNIHRNLCKVDRSWKKETWRLVWFHFISTSLYTSCGWISSHLSAFLDLSTCVGLCTFILEGGGNFILFVFRYNLIHDITYFILSGATLRMFKPLFTQKLDWK